MPKTTECSIDIMYTPRSANQDEEKTYIQMAWLSVLSPDILLGLDGAVGLLNRRNPRTVEADPSP